MPEFAIRKVAVLTEEIFHDGGAVAKTPRRRGAALALVKSPFAGRHAEELQSAMDDLKPLGLTLTDRLIEALGGDVSAIDSYGKGAIVGTGGELEHGALWHAPGGYAMRARLDVPLGHINAAYVRSHFDAVEVSAPDGLR